MKREIVDHINVILESGGPLTDSQARMIAYWESVDFQNKSEYLLKIQGLKLAGHKILEDYDDEMSTLV